MLDREVVRRRQALGDQAAVAAPGVSLQADEAEAPIVRQRRQLGEVGLGRRRSQLRSVDPMVGRDIAALGLWSERGLADPMLF